MNHLIVFGVLIVIFGVGFSPAHALRITDIVVAPHLETTPPGGFVKISFDIEGSVAPFLPVSATYPGELKVGGPGGFTDFTIVFFWSPSPIIDGPAMVVTAANFAAKCAPLTCPFTDSFDGEITLQIELMNTGEFGIAGGHLTSSSTFGRPDLHLEPSGIGFVSWGNPSAVPEAGSTLFLLALSLSVGGLFAGVNALGVLSRPRRRLSA